MKAVLVVFAGSGLGGLMRYFTHMLVTKRLPLDFPLGTFLINISGSLLIGIFYALAEKQRILSPDTRLFLMTGLCGGFTTFSTFSLDNLVLLRSGQYLYFALYAIGSVVLGLAATFAGMYLVKVF